MTVAVAVAVTAAVAAVATAALVTAALPVAARCRWTASPRRPWCSRCQTRRPAGCCRPVTRSTPPSTASGCPCSRSPQAGTSAPGRRPTGAFADDPDVSFVADDGSRRGDDAPVLVVHSTPELAARHLDDPDTAAAPLLAAADRLLGTGTDPVWWRVRRWTFARPADGRSEPFHLGDDLLGVCGDGWAERSKVEAAYLSGRALGRALADRLS
ncbi:hypothetical protein GCM10025868_40970 [Angustibacter aerolatus]|uniref:Amine oxidase domain-containing protein n=1 Tax=Angustibacter aerolatus TaxID=1162965 RepID=A0ABQ6JPS7_9ACTN|nr:hypothetical protein [Angustibacter aerolatus]GMA88847.1 hypothetical protein GCM10025868_40970 [Angustibacter aerolatus]